MNTLRHKAPTRRDAADAVRLKAEGAPSHINAGEARLLQRVMPEAAGPVITKGLLAEAGRRGDDRVTKLIPAEAALLKRRGGAGTRNPKTGLLEYWGGDSPGTSGGGGGEGGDNGVGGPGNGSAGTGPGQGSANGGFGADGSISGGYGLDSYGSMGSYSDNFSDDGGYGYNSLDPSHAKPSIANMSLAQIQSVLKDTWDTIDEDRFGAWAGRTKPTRTDGWASPDTGWRALQEFWEGPALNEPGRYGAPTKAGPGIFGSFLSQITPSLALGALPGVPAFSVGLRAGGALGRASSQATQEASAREDAARSAHNSTGSDGDTVSGLSLAALAKTAPGARSGAETAKLVPPAGYTVNPAGQIVPAQGGNNKPAYQDPIRNLLYDYILRGRRGSGFAW